MCVYMKVNNKRNKLHTQHKDSDPLHDRTVHQSGRAPHDRRNQKVFYEANI